MQKMMFLHRSRSLMVYGLADISTIHKSWVCNNAFQGLLRTNLLTQWVLFGMDLLRETRVQQPDQFFDRLFLVLPAGDDADLRPAHDTQGEHAQQALGVDSALVFFNPDGRFELVGFLNKKCGRPGVKAHLILNHDIFYEHIRLSPSS